MTTTVAKTKPTRYLLRFVGTRNAGRKRGAIPPLKGLAPIILVLAIWAIFGNPNSVSYPPPHQWFVRLADLWNQDLLLPAILQSLQTFGVGIVLSVIFGSILGYLIGSFRWVDRATAPILEFVRALPPPALVSLIMLVVGINLFAVQLMVVLGCIWPILLNTASGVREQPALRLDVSRSLGLSRLEHLRKVVIPALVPNILLGVRVAVSVAFVVTLFVELMGVTEGLGSLLSRREERFDSEGVWGVLLIIGILGYLLSVLVTLVERRMLRHRPQ